MSSDKELNITLKKNACLEKITQVFKNSKIK